MAQHSISPNRWPPNCAFPPSGCWVIIEYGPVERAWILSSTRGLRFRMSTCPTVRGWACPPAAPVEHLRLAVVVPEVGPALDPAAVGPVRVETLAQLLDRPLRAGLFLL